MRLVGIPPLRHYRAWPMRVNPVLDRLGAYPIATVHERARELRDAGQQGHRLLDRRSPRADTSLHPRSAQGGRAGGVAVPDDGGTPELREAIADYLASPIRRHRRSGHPDHPDVGVEGSGVLHAAGLRRPCRRRRGGLRDARLPDLRTRGAVRRSRDRTRCILRGDFVMRRRRHAGRHRGSGPGSCGRARPHNPTGAVTDRGTLRGLVERCRDGGCAGCSPTSATPTCTSRRPSRKAHRRRCRWRARGPSGVLAYYSLLEAVRDDRATGREPSSATPRRSRR